MSVLIKGMKMPENCLTCNLAKYYEGEDALYCPFTDVMCLSIGRQDACPLVALPKKHRRLIEEPKELYYGELAVISPLDFRAVAEYFAVQIKAQPTVLEAEGEE